MARCEATFVMAPDAWRPLYVRCQLDDNESHEGAPHEGDVSGMFDGQRWSASLVWSAPRPTGNESRR